MRLAERGYKSQENPGYGAELHLSLKSAPAWTFHHEALSSRYHSFGLYFSVPVDRRPGPFSHCFGGLRAPWGSLVSVSPDVRKSMLIDMEGTATALRQLQLASLRPLARHLPPLPRPQCQARANLWDASHMVTTGIVMDLQRPGLQG